MRQRSTAKITFASPARDNITAMLSSTGRKGSFDAGHDQPADLFIHCIELLGGAGRDMKELRLAYEMHQQDGAVDALGDTVKIEFFVEVGRLAEAAHNVCRANLVSIGNEASVGEFADFQRALKQHSTSARRLHIADSFRPTFDDRLDNEPLAFLNRKCARLLDVGANRDMHSVKRPQGFSDDVQVSARDWIKRSSVQGLLYSGLTHIKTNLPNRKVDSVVRPTRLQVPAYCGDHSEPERMSASGSIAAIRTTRNTKTASPPQPVKIPSIPSGSSDAVSKNSRTAGLLNNKEEQMSDSNR
jgi:hypothetical protein